MSGDNLALDTNAAIQILNGSAPPTWILPTTKLFLPVPVIGELRYGALNSAKQRDNMERIEKLCLVAAPLNCTASTASTYAELRADLKRKGRPIPENDLWIAALCVEHDMLLATADPHFDSIARLLLKKI